MCVVLELAELQVTAAARASQSSPADGEAAGRNGSALDAFNR